METNLIKTESPTPVTLVQQAIEKGMGIQELEKLLEMQERWEKKEARKKFFDAMSLFQTKVPELKKSKTADLGTFKYKYADLGSITKAVNPILNECGLSYRWDFKEEKEIMEVTCIVSHRDGHSEQTTMRAARDNSGKKNDIQQKGSTHTYLQRYTLIGALGLSTADSDMDGKGGIDKKPLTDEEILQQWTDMVNQFNTRVALTAYYMKNRKAIENIENKEFRDKVQAIFKAHEKTLPETKKTTVLP